jgi:hypothetical protein
MSIAGLAASSFFSGNIAHSTQTLSRQLQQEFERLGQDIQTGNVHQAQADLAILKTDLPPATATQGKAQRLRKNSNNSRRICNQATWREPRRTLSTYARPHAKQVCRPPITTAIQSWPMTLKVLLLVSMGQPASWGKRFREPLSRLPSGVTARRYNNWARMDRPSLLSTSA